MRQERTVQATIFEVFAQHEVACVKFSKIRPWDRVLVASRQWQHPFVRSETTIPPSRPAFWQSAARSGSQGCRRGGTGAAGAQRP
jgi:hypothetical protein